MWRRRCAPECTECTRIAIEFRDAFPNPPHQPRTLNKHKGTRGGAEATLEGGGRPGSLEQGQVVSKSKVRQGKSKVRQPRARYQCR